MSSLATETIALRAAGLWAMGIFAIAALSAYSARPAREAPAPLWLVIPLLLSKIGILLGPAGLALVVGRATGRWSETASMAAIAFAVLVGLWASLVLVQIAQNVAYRLVGAPVQTIRLLAQNKPKRRRRPRKA